MMQGNIPLKHVFKSFKKFRMFREHTNSFHILMGMEGQITQNEIIK